MAKDGFFIENMFRAYPFVPYEEGAGSGKAGSDMDLPEDSIVDVSFLVSPLVSFSHTEDVVSLSYVSRSGGNITFVFVCDNDALAADPIAFSVPETSDRFSLFYYEGSNWSGYLTIGDLSSLLGTLLPESTISPTDFPPVVEPALIVYEAASVRKIRLANKNRTRFSRPDGCEESSSSVPSSSSTNEMDPIIVRPVEFTGNVSFTDGYNTSARQTSSSIVIEAGIGRGAGEPCDEVKLFDSEDAPAGATTLDGSLRCNEIISSINGLTGRTIIMQSGQGVRIYPGEAHELIVDVDLSGMAICSTGADPSSSSSSPVQSSSVP